MGEGGRFLLSGVVAGEDGTAAGDYIVRVDLSNGSHLSRRKKLDPTGRNRIVFSK